MNKSTAIHMILDASGSMNSIKNDTIGSVNDYIKNLARDNPEAKFWLTAFNSNKLDTLVHGSLANLAKPITETEYTCSGMTPLYDAIGKTIDILSATDAEAKILVIVTDGEENRSREYTKASIASLLTEKQNTDNWLVLYLGANQDAFREGSQIGTQSVHTMDFAPSKMKMSMNATYGATSRFMRSGNRADAAYTAEERKAAI